MKKQPTVNAPVTDPTKNFGSFTNAAGKTFAISGLSPLTPQHIMESVRQKWIKDGKIIPICPTYEVVTASGEVEIHEHDATTLIVEGDAEKTKINQEKWQEYSRLSAELDGEYNIRLMRVVFLAVEAVPTDDWRNEMDFVGVDLPPKGSAQEKYLYIETEVVKSAQDIAKLMTGVFRLAGIINEAAVADAEAAFQRMLEGAFVEAGVSPGEVGKLESQSVLQ
jgi:hypothetical protein